MQEGIAVHMREMQLGLKARPYSHMSSCGSFTAVLVHWCLVCKAYCI
jgi:hypothetical protein